MTTQTKKNPGTHALIAALLGMFVVTPFSTMIAAHVSVALWNRFLFAQYGDGPSLRTWFGIQFLIALHLYWIKKDAMFEPDDAAPYSSLIIRTILYAFMPTVLLLSGMLAATVWGWS